MSPNEAPTVEVERKFILGTWRRSSSPRPIVQGYLTVDGIQATLLRRSSGVYVSVVGLKPDRTQTHAEILVTDPQDIERFIDQVGPEGVFPLAPGFEARLRLTGSDVESGVAHGKGKFTMKSAIGGSDEQRLEFECATDVPTIEQTVEQGLIIGEPIKKWRYTEPLKDIDGERVTAASPGGNQPLTVEIDVYSGSSLRIAEVEFPPGSSTQLDLPRIPTLGHEVTSDKRFSNARIAVYGVPAFKLPGNKDIRDGGGELPGLAIAPITRINARTTS